MYIRKSNYIGERLTLEMRDYNLKTAHLYQLTGVGMGGINKWKNSKNGVSHTAAEKLVFLFGCSRNELCDGGRYYAPSHPVRTDMDEWVPEVLHIMQTMDMFQKSEVQAFRLDVKKRCVEWLNSRKPRALVNTVMEAKMPEELKALGNSGPQFTVATELLHNQPSPAPAAPIVGSTEAAKIKLFLQQANDFAKRNNLTWILDEDGVLKAQRVTVEKF